MEQAPKKRRGVNRFLLLIVLILSVTGAIFFPPIMPHIQLPAEPLTHEPLFSFLGQDFHFTNTMTAVLIADVILILVALSFRRQIKKGALFLTGIAGVFSALLQGLYEMTESTAGKWAKKIFPYFATIFLLVLMINLMELLPGVDSIGILRKAEDGHHGYAVEKVVGLNTIVDVEEDDHGEHGEETMYGFFPFVRVASTDLNFTLSLALVSVVMTQVIGFQTLGMGYITKYWDTASLKKSWKKPQFGDPLSFILALVNFIVGILEIVAEISKILSFTFRLFGVIFAGSVLLFFIGSMVPVFAQSLVLLLELLFGPLQAFVFGMLTMMFMSMATHSHAHEEEAH